MNIRYETDIPEDIENDAHEEQLSLLVDYDALEREQAAEEEEDLREHNLQKATLKIQEKYGRNAVLKGVNLMKGATTVMRNQQIGGHSAGHSAGE